MLRSDGPTVSFTVLNASKYLMLRLALPPDRTLGLPSVLSLSGLAIVIALKIPSAGIEI
jgi:hypothetical protein